MSPLINVNKKISVRREQIDLLRINETVEFEFVIEKKEKEQQKLYSCQKIRKVSGIVMVLNFCKAMKYESLRLY